MTSRLTTEILKRPASQPGKTTVGAVAGVEISGFPQLLYTRSFGDPDTLFVPLLDASRESCRMIERLCSQGEDRKMAVTLSTMHLVTSLLQDSSFTVVAKGASHENAYCVDLEGGTLRMDTRLYAMVSHRTSFFRIEIAGKILEGQFAIRSPLQERTLFQVSEEDLRKPNFFSALLAPECLRVQMEQERLGAASADTGQEVRGEVRMMLVLGRDVYPVVLKQNKGLKRWDIVDGRKQEWVGSLSPEAEQSLEQVVRFLRELYTPS